jgi:hypothetical protein
MSRSQEFRRYHHARRKKEVADRLRPYFESDGCLDNRLVGLHVNTRKVCSCPACGNRRKYHGPSAAELRRIPLAD